MAEKIPGWFERLLLPKLSSLEGELKAFRGEFSGELRAVNGGIESLEKQMLSLRGEMNARFDSIEGKISLWKMWRG